MKNRWAVWIAATLLWSVLGILFALPDLSSDAWGQALLGSLAQWWSWGVLAPLVFWIDARLPFEERQLRRRALAHLPVSVVVTILHSYLVISMRAGFGLHEWG